MSAIETHFGQACYHHANAAVELYATVLAGNVNPYFRLGDRTVAPFFIPPWWNEGWLEDAPPLFNTCRGNFFCLPMGGDLGGSRGKVIPIHGRCANENWLFKDTVRKGGESILNLVFEEELGRIDKELRLVEDQTLIYENNTCTGWEGDYPVAYHPTLKLPEKPGSAHFAMSAFVDGYSTFESHESAENGGYSLFRNGQKITDLRKIKTIFDTEVDFTSQPIQAGYEDVFMTISDPGDAFAYIAVTYREADFVYFQLKNPRNLKNTMFWVSNGGRHYPPWNGRCRPVLGLEETVSFFHYGLPRSAEKNPVNSLGFDTAVAMRREKSHSFPFIYGVAGVPKGFRGVKDARKTAGGIRFTGLDGEQVDVAVDLGYLERI